MSEIPTPPIAAPTRVALTLARYVLGFGVWFVLSLAPFLGRLRVPLFSPLLDMYPLSLQDWLIPASGVLMGLLAVIVDFASTKGVPQRTLTRWFVRAVALFIASFLLLVVVYVLVVVRVEQTVVGPKGQRERTSSAYVTGALDVPRQPPGSECGCPEGQAAERCIENITLSPTNIRSCFGSQRVALASVALALLYLTLTGTFVAAIGLLVLSRHRGRRPGRGRRPTRAASPAP